MTDHPELTEQEYEWAVDHTEEALRRIDRVLEITGIDEYDMVQDLSRARGRLQSWQTYLAIQVKKANGIGEEA